LSHIGITRVRLSPPTLEDIARRNTLEAYDEIWGNDEHVQSYLGADRLIFYQRIAKLCVKYKPKRVLDVGCGTGDFMRIFKRRLIDDRIITNFYGLDYSKNAITRATGRFPEGSFLIGDGYNLCYADSSLDLVVAMEILEHVSRPKDMVREFIRVCEPGGRVVITVPDGGYDNWPGHQNFWTEDTLRQMLVDIGLQGIEKISENKVLVATLLSK
jgi:ubiquinone/menaquinone biosynthesis C-methylase UbiE